MPDRHLFSEKEVADIVLQATKLQEDAPAHEASYAPGFSRDEILKMAEDLGIEPRYIEEAMRRRTTSTENEGGFKLLGAPFSATFERIVDGDVESEDFDLLLEDFAATGPRGQAVHTQVGRAVNSRIARGLAFGNVTIRSRDGRTRIMAKQTAFIPFMTTLYPALLGGLVAGIPLMAKGSIPVVWGLAGITTLMTAAFLGFRALAKIGVNQMRKIVDSMADRASEVARPRDDLSRETLASTTVPEVEVKSSEQNQAD